MVTKKTGGDSRQLRADAETQLALTPSSCTSRSSLPAEGLLHELQVYQVELEMQNEELRQAHRALEESRDRYVDLYEFAPISYFTLTREGIISEANLTGASLLGVEREKLLRRRFASFVMPEDTGRWHRHFMSSLQHGEEQRCELALKRDDGSLFYARLDTLGRNIKGDAPLVFITLVDTTESRSAAMALHRSEEMFRRLAQISPAGIFHADTQGACDYVNERWSEITGLSIEESLGDGWMLALHKEDRERTLALWREAMSTMQPKPMEWRMQRHDGTVRWAFGEAATELDAQGRIAGFIGIVNDITERKQAEIKLRESEERYRQTLQTSIDGFWIASSDGRILDVNDAYCQMISYEREELLNMRIPDLEAMESPEETARHIQEVLTKGHDRFETRHRRKDGQVLEIEISTVHQPGEDGGYFCAFLRDITKSKQVEEDLRIAAIAFESQAGVMVTDANGIIVRVNQAFTHLTGYSAEEAVGQTSALLKSGRHDQAFYQGMWETLKQKGYWQGQMWNRRKNGKIYAEWLTITAVTAPDGRITHYVGTFSDITQNREAEAEIHRLAYYDPLTLLPNRRLLQDRLGQVLAATVRNGHCGAILFLDMDNFKTLNDTRGHDIGDLLLVEVAQRLKTCVRGVDTVARLGGDEFVVLLEDLSGEFEEAAAQAKLVGDKVQEVIARSYHLKGCEYYCTTSIGISLFRDNNVTVDELLKHADLAMYQSKNAGRNTQRFFDPAMQAALDEHSALETDLRLALKRQQLRLYYQPQMESTRGLVGAEALLRWVHPERGLVEPGDFISIAEETGFILPIGYWVLETACAQLKAWEGNPRTHELQLAVNVSARQFRQPDFAVQVQQVLAQSGADPTRLKIELTESLVLDNVSDTIIKMQALKAIGVGFSMDDFGTGYSSLSYLTRLPLDQLKIDRSFIRDFGSDANGAAIVQTIIIMGKTLGLNVIAEGVETVAQRDFLDRNGCHAFQGFLFSRPLPLADFEQFMNLNARLH
ncbi:diguanylate cyclase/phosphodiesterase with PAS/PAC sensor(s) [Sulfuricella denitrificans skB26]|uniref:Diguanylate cyclase/phosphodiesterase with PAS/PAC sensor(S) n=1 Tax=Sulfuricella denitrificans (strain DSM 22764 / NBRC 105220 / skB26) TaxID=1163617 RepID=S6B1F2_SULDS|nr:PAS domain S-box protein [Sulfuricella denitrificans]BAN34527.1 diguanylate cyclase/phosphodiesterase with PAS/PAC sensor(s) [Sulfuricella denitrificans skB26]